MIIQINDCASVNSKNVTSVEIKTYISNGGDEFQTLVPLIYKKVYTYKIFIVVNGHEILFDYGDWEYYEIDEWNEKILTRLECMYKKAIKLMKKIIKESDNEQL